MEQSILKSTKKLLNVRDDDAAFDLDIITHINAEFSILTDMGVGPEGGFVIEGEDEVWESYYFEESDSSKLKVELSKVKTCVYLRTRLLFDPPTSGYLLEAMQKQLQEAEWRLNVNREETEWVDPDPMEFVVVDGGDPAGP